MIQLGSRTKKSNSDSQCCQESDSTQNLRLRNPAYRYITSSFSGHSFRVNAGETVVQFDFCLISNIFSCRYTSITLRMKLLTLISCIKIWC